MDQRDSEYEYLEKIASKSGAPAQIKATDNIRHTICDYSSVRSAERLEKLWQYYWMDTETAQFSFISPSLIGKKYTGFQ
jgi:hypothetical protein